MEPDIADMMQTMEPDIKDIIQKSTHLTEFDKDVLSAVFGQLKASQAKELGEIAKTVKGQLSHTSDPEINRIWNIVTVLIDKEEINAAQENGLKEMIPIDAFEERMLLHIKKSNMGDAGRNGYGKRNEPIGKNEFRQRSGFEGIGSDDVAAGQEKFRGQESSKRNKGNTYTAGVAFLDCKYREMTDYMNRGYTAHVVTEKEEYDVKYFLKSYEGFYKVEELLERTASQYGIRKPPLFSPMSRRAVAVQLDFGNRGISQTEKLQVDFQLERNGIGGIVQAGKTLAWNVDIADKNEMPRPRENTSKSIAAFFDNVYQIYEFPAERNEFIYVDTDSGDVKRYGDTVYLNAGEQDMDNVRYWKIRVDSYAEKYLEGAQHKFQNNFQLDLNRIYKERVRTEADVDYVVKAFEGGGIEYLEVLRKVDGYRAVRNYENRDSYHYPKNKRLRGSSRCYIRFAERDSDYFEDYISYILAYMNYHYPEFYWVGVV